jgi:hypothetical protein
MASSEELIVDAIIRDMCDRSGGDHWFEGCDEDIQHEIRRTWERICTIVLKEDLPTEGHPSLGMRIANMARDTVVL